MLWYLANGSLNDYLKSQVVLQSQYYSGQQSQLLTATYSADKGQTLFEQLSIENPTTFSQPKLLTVDRVTVQLAKVASTQLNSPSIQNKNTTVVNIEKLTLHKLHVWSEINSDGKTNLRVVVDQVSKQLAADYPALYPNISAKLYAKAHPELNATQEIAQLEQQKNNQSIEINKAVIASKKAKHDKRILGKAQNRALISSIVIEELIFTRIKDNQRITEQFYGIELDEMGDKNGLDSNQIGGELLRRLLNTFITIEKDSNL
jgi:hypothetical protein